MKKLWRSLPFVARWMLVTIFLLVLTAGGAYAYVALTATGEVTVEECLSFVGPNTFSVSLYPQESITAQVTIANASQGAIDIDLASTVVPDPGTKGLTIDIPAKITVPAIGQVAVSIIVTAGKSAEPGVYNISILFDR